MEKVKSLLEEERDLREVFFIPPAPHGYVDELSEACGVSKRTVQRALRDNLVSRKAIEIRRLYYEKYLHPYLPHGGK